MAILNRNPEPKEAPKPKRPPTMHDALVLKAERWLRNLGCAAVVRDPFNTPLTRETPDAIGWLDGLSVLVEVKTSRSDFLADFKKPFRLHPETGMGDWRFYMCPPGVIHADDLPNGWGLVWVENNRVIDTVGVPSNCRWHSDQPFIGNKTQETILLAYALKAVTKALKEA